VSQKIGGFWVLIDAIALQVHMRKATVDAQRRAEQLQLQLKQGESAFGSLCRHEHVINVAVELNPAQAELLAVEKVSLQLNGLSVGCFSYCLSTGIFHISRLP
jgi:hypothetical protein